MGIEWERGHVPMRSFKPPEFALAISQLLSKYMKGTIPGKRKYTLKLAPKGKMRYSFKLPSKGNLKYNFRQPFKGKLSYSFKMPSPIKLMNRKPSAVSRPIHTLFKGLTKTLSNIKRQTSGEDYLSAVRNFIPAGARIVSPNYPTTAGEYQLADLDGDSRNELITSYQLGNVIKTVILKKHDGKWNKIGEISKPGFDTLHYRGAADIKGKNGRQLLIGLRSAGELPVLYGHEIGTDGIREIFSRSYHRFELLGQPQDNGGDAGNSLAFWDKRDGDAYDIDVLHWNGSQLAAAKDTSYYHHRRVVPHYMSRLRQKPYSPESWYNLAEALVKARAHNDALTAIELGSNLDRDSKYKEKFLDLRNRISGV